MRFNAFSYEFRCEGTAGAPRSAALGAMLLPPAARLLLTHAATSLRARADALAVAVVRASTPWVRRRALDGVLRSAAAPEARVLAAAAVTAQQRARRRARPAAAPRRW